MSRFRHSSSITDLQLAVTTYEKVLDLYPEGLWDQGMLLYNAATAICTRADHLGDLNDLQKGIKLYRDALNFINETHIFYSSFATSLATSLVDRFIRKGDVDDLKECINLHEKALHYRPKGNPDRLRSLVNLAGALHIRFELGGSLDDEEDSIRLYREALDLCPEGHPDRAWALNNLATALKVRFEQFEDTTDLNEVITLGEEALALYHKGRVGRSLALYNVASAFHTRYDRLGDANDGERSVQLLLEAFDTMSESSPYRAYTLKSLSAILLLQYQRSGNVNALKRAIDECHRALELLPEGHPERPQHLHQLANLIAARGQQAGAMGDMEKAIKLTVDSIEGLPAGHPDGSLHRQSLAWFYLHNFNMSTDATQLELAFKALSAAVNDIGRNPRLRLNNAVDWLAAIENIKSLDSYLNPSGRESLVEDYQQTIHLLPQVAYFGLDIGSRLRVLKLSERLANDGAAHALVIEKPQTAIEMLEEGRAVFWTQALRLRTLFDKLPSQISDELRSLSRQLELDSYRRAVAAPEAINVARFLEDDTARRRRLSVKFESKIKEARAVPGFERFLLNEEFSHLAQVSERGPVVVLLAGKSSCQAIAIQRDKTTERIALPSVTLQKLEKLSFMLKGSNVKLRDLDYDDFDEPSERKGSQGTGSGGVFLGYLWQKIVKPVIHAMGIPRSQGRNRPRLWWCPTGPFSFLPLHAAGTYRDLKDSVTDDIKGEFDDEFECCADYVVSSYTPTLQALINARRELDPIPRTGAKVLLVAEPGVPGTVSYLNKASEEVEIVARVVGAKAILRLDGDGHDQPQSGPTVQMVVDKLPAATVVHLSCHGQQHLADPLESGFVLRDRKKLTVARLMQLRLTKALFAFLAACETARGDRAQPDQTVHLAATMFFTGFKSIIGTMWSMWDKDGPFVADVVYRELFKDGLLAPDDIPYALDSATRQLRAKGVPAEQWATYIHIGV
ncbi:hypothetical protein AcV5_000032 [Taiwanofungus camphoratus]|nr:hypothetical protein AcV5_000032 [Antrodia cinnamomea]